MVNGSSITGSAPPDKDGGWPQLIALLASNVIYLVAWTGLFPLYATLAEHFQVSSGTILWTYTAPALGAVSIGGMLPGFGRLWGNRRVFLFTVATMLVGCTIAAMAQSVLVLCIGLFAMGVGALAMGLGLGVIAHHYSGRKMQRAIAMVVFIIPAGTIVAYWYSTIITRYFHWQFIYWTMAGLAAVVLLLGFLFVKETPKATGVRVDVVGALGVLVWGILILLPVSQANSWGWSSGRTLSLLLPGIAVLLFWIVWELRSKDPLLNLRVVALPGVWQATIIYGIVLVFGSSGFSVIMSYLIETPPELGGYGFGRSFYVTAAVLTSASITGAITAPFYPALSRRVGSRWVLTLAGVCVLAAFPLAAWHSQLWMIVLCSAISGMAFGWGGVALQIATESVSPEMGVIVDGIILTCQNLMVAIAGAVYGYVLTVNVIDVGEGYLLPAGSTITWAMIIAGVMGVIAVLVALTIKPHRLIVADRGLTESPAKAE